MARNSPGPRHSLPSQDSPGPRGFVDFHDPGVQWTRLQAEAPRLPLVTANTVGIKEKELSVLEESLLRVVASNGLECVVTEAIGSEYQKSRIDRI